MSSNLSVQGSGTGNEPVAAISKLRAPVASLPAPVPPSHHAAGEADVLQRAAQRVVDSMQQGGNSFKFTFDKQSGITIVRVINKATGELVRQIPTEEIVHVAQLLRQDVEHLLLDVTV